MTTVGDHAPVVDVLDRPSSIGPVDGTIGQGR